MSSKNEPVRHEVKQYKPYPMLHCSIFTEHCIVSLLNWMVHHYRGWCVLFHFMLHWFIITSETIQAMSSKDEPGSQEVKECKLCPVRMNQWGMKWNNTNHTQQWWTNEASETIQAMSSNDDPVREVKKCKSCPVRMNQWGKWNNTYHAQWWTS
jgi:hypothetical protein